MKNEQLRIYLAGTIYKEEPASRWKDDLIESIDDRDDKYLFIDPDPSFECSIAVVPQDKALINSCDVVVAYIERPSFGTAMEIYHAYNRNDIVVITINPNKLFFKDFWLRYHSSDMVENVHQASDIIKSLNVIYRK